MPRSIQLFAVSYIIVEKANPAMWHSCVGWVWAPDHETAEARFVDNSGVEETYPRTHWVYQVLSVAVDEDMRERTRLVAEDLYL